MSTPAEFLTRLNVDPRDGRNRRVTSRPIGGTSDDDAPAHGYLRPIILPINQMEQIRRAKEVADATGLDLSEVIDIVAFCSGIDDRMVLLSGVVMASKAHDEIVESIK